MIEEICLRTYPKNRQWRDVLQMSPEKLIDMIGMDIGHASSSPTVIPISKVQTK